MKMDADEKEVSTPSSLAKSKSAKDGKHERARCSRYVKATSGGSPADHPLSGKDLEAIRSGSLR